MVCGLPMGENISTVGAKHMELGVKLRGNVVEPSHDLVFLIWQGDTKRGLIFWCCLRGRDNGEDMSLVSGNLPKLIRGEDFERRVLKPPLSPPRAQVYAFLHKS